MFNVTIEATDFFLVLYKNDDLQKLSGYPLDQMQPWKNMKNSKYTKFKIKI